MAVAEQTGRKFTRRQMLRLALLAAGGAALGACAPGEKPTPIAQPPAPAELITLVVIGWGGGGEGKDPRDVALRTAYPELDERFTPVKTITADGAHGVAEELRLRLAAGQDVPDIVYVNYEQFPEFAISGELVDLGHVYEHYKDDLYDGVFQLVIYDGKYLGFPFRLKSKMFFWRGDLFEEAGLDPTEIVTVSDLISVGQAFHERFPDSYMLNMGPEPAGYFVWEVLSAYPDARFAEPGGKWRVTTDKAFSETFKFFKDIYDAKIALPIEDWSTDWQKGFEDSAICGSFISNWMKDFLPKFAPEQGGKWEFGLWPVLEPLADQRYGGDTGGGICMVPKRCAHPEEAVDYLTKMYLEKEGQLAIFKALGYTPLVKSARDEYLNWGRTQTKPEGMSDDEWAIMPYVYFGPEIQEAELESFEYLRAFQMDPSAVKEKSILDQWLNRYLTDQVSLDEALQNAEKDMQSQIGDPFEL
jgi:multiple sugar transport system substrate-binding protein